jgi:hypothetical protein
MSAALRQVAAARPAGSPPAVYEAFVIQNRWKNWVLAGQFVAILMLVVCVLAIGRRDPDVVLVEPDGKSHYLNRSMASGPLMQFLAEQRQLPSDVTVMHFSKEFLTTALALNSSTIDAAWPQALAMMDASLRGRVGKESAQGKLVEGYKAAQLSSSIAIDDLVVVERTPSLLHLRAALSRSKVSLLTPNGMPETEKISVDLVERIVPRSVGRPDGLEVAEYKILAAPVSSPTAAQAQ